jgi:hypothetical protein
LKKLLDHVGTLDEIGEVRESMTEEHFSPAIDMLNWLCNAFDQFSPLFTQYKHLIQLHRPVTILYAALGDNDSFLKFVTDTEKKLSQNFLSLSIKPVQRLPRYILLLKEMLKCAHRSVQLCDGVNKDFLMSTRLHLRETCVEISNCTLLCNNAMREYEDLQKLHRLDRQFKDCQLKKKFNFVTIRKYRVHVLEGEVKRRHDRIGIKSYLCHVFSDIMLVSVVAGKGGGLKLKNIIPLHFNCGVACLPVPNSALSSVDSTEEGCWFAIVSEKVMFFAMKTSAERDKWGSAINSVLFKNGADYDVLYTAEILQLYNKSVDAYFKRPDGTMAGEAEAESAVCVTQVNWWHILSKSVDKNIAKDAISQICAKAVVRLLKTFDKKKLGPLEELLSHSIHFPICYDYFFDFPKKTSRTSSSSDFHPPCAVKLYLFHDVVIAAALAGNADGRSAYYFHINLSSLEVRSETSLSITLVDTSVVCSKGIMQSLWKSDVRERTLTACTIEGKRKWLALMREALSTLQSSRPLSINPDFCTKVRLSGISSWKYEDRPSINWDNLG